MFVLFFRSVLRSSVVIPDAWQNLLTSETNRPMLTIALLICVVLCSAKWRPNEGWRDDHFPYCHTEKNDQFLLVIGATTRQITLNNSLKIHMSPKKRPFQQEISSSNHLFSMANKLLVFGGAGGIFVWKEPCKKLKNHHSEASSLPLEGWGVEYYSIINL